MSTPVPRRSFLGFTADAARGRASSALAVVERARPMPRARVGLPALVRTLVDEPADVAAERIARHVDDGLSADDLGRALTVAAAAVIAPRAYRGPEYHPFLTASARDAARLFAGRERFVPLFWHLFALKDAQSEQAGHKGALRPARGHAADAAAAIARLESAIAAWDESDVEAAAVTALRSAPRAEVEEVLVQAAARDLGDLGHKTIAVANGLRAARDLTGPALETVMQAIALALVQHDDEGSNGGHSRQTADAFARHAARLGRLAFDASERDFLAERDDEGARRELVASLREDDAVRAAYRVTDLLARGMSPLSVLDAYQLGAAELVLRAPDEIVAAHAPITSSALRFCACRTSRRSTMHLLLLQGCARLVAFREYVATRASLLPLTIDDLDGNSPTLLSLSASAVTALYARDVAAGARGIHDAASRGSFGDAELAELRRTWCMRATDSHDFELSHAVAQEMAELAPNARPAYLAGTLAHLRHRVDSPSERTERARAVLGL